MGALALLLRLGLVGWAATRFPAVEDGLYYHRLATRLAAGAGYTWAWPDGVVTYAAHYPVGYPWLVSLGYRLFGAHVAVAMVLHAVLGAVAALALSAVVRDTAGRRAGLLAGVLLGVHPALLFYTPAVMTEGVTASLLSISVYLAHRARRARRSGFLPGWPLVLLGASLGLVTLVRPQALLVAVVLGALTLRRRAGDSAARDASRRTAAAALVTAVALLVCAPWTARNCVRMKSCALVSVNGGWNLLIGASDQATGHWTPLDVPAACRTVWDEAGKDACFAAEARRAIAVDPLRYLALVPAKLAATFDYCGAAPWYLHASSAEAFGSRAKSALAVIETLFTRLTVLFALSFAGWKPGPRRPLRALLAAFGAAFLFSTHAAVSFLALVAVLALGRPWRRGGALVAGTLAVLGSTALVHAVFFGAGRYSLVVMPFVTALSAAALTLTRPRRDTHRPCRS